MKIVDCFIFNNELDLLEARLEYLFNTVDYFVIVESDKTFTGIPKILFFEENKTRFQKYINKIIYHPITFSENLNSAWDRETFQRNQIKEACKRLKDNVNLHILLSDLDEFPNNELLQSLRSEKDLNTKLRQIAPLPNKLLVLKQTTQLFFKWLRHKRKGSSNYDKHIKLYKKCIFNEFDLPITLSMSNRWYFINYKDIKKSNWKGGQLFRYEWFQNHTANELRGFRSVPLRTKNNAGWHFSFLGGRTTIKNKIKSFSHQEHNIPQVVKDEYLDYCIENGLDIFKYHKTKKHSVRFVKEPLETLPKDLSTIFKRYNEFILD